jgi:hypothetical protein
MTPRLAIAALLLSLGAAAGCASEEYYCDDTGCYYCDGVGCRSVDPPERAPCRGDFECAEGQICTTTGCIPTCGGDGECAEGTSCSLDLTRGGGGGLCVGPNEDPEPKPGTCERNADCDDPTLVCRDGLCQPDDRSCGSTGCSCTASSGCDDGFLCLDGECRAESDTCQFSYECSGPDGRNAECVDGECVLQCSEDADCAAGQRCSEGQCVDREPMTGCVKNEDCGAAGVCQDGACFVGCDEDSDCGAGQYCPDGICRVDTRPQPFCTSDAQCQPGHPCVGGICRTPCDTDTECLMFDVQFSLCRESFCKTSNEVTSDCRTSADCESGEECVDGICR